MIDINDINKYKPNEIVILTTGSQGEPMSALTRMANGDHKKVKLNSTDTVLISAVPIPGNEKTVFSVINKLTEVTGVEMFKKLLDQAKTGDNIGAPSKIGRASCRERV